MKRVGLVLAGLVLAACARPAPGPDMAVILSPKPAPDLADYGLFRDAGARQPSAGVVAYDLVNPLFTDYADKYRFAYIPEGGAARFAETDVFDFPVGSVLVKTFAYEDRYIETRLLIHQAEGWQAIPYVWNEAGTQARYAPIGARLDLDVIGYDGVRRAFTYAVPNKNQCKTCHQSGDTLTPIGPKARNLNKPMADGANQLEAWLARGMIDTLGTHPERVPDAFDETMHINDRARAYLDINCAHCHKPDGSASNSGLWLDWNEEDRVKLGVNKHPVAAGRGAGRLELVIAPGESEQSILTFRMASSEAGIAMPELGRALIDEAGVELIEDWIYDMPDDWASD